MKYSQETYRQMFDQLLSEELLYGATAASPTQILVAMKIVLGRAIRQGLIKKYTNLSLQDNFDITFVIIEGDGDVVGLHLVYGE